MEYRFIFIDTDGKEEQSICNGPNFLSCLWGFYDVNGTRNIISAERI